MAYRICAKGPGGPHIASRQRTLCPRCGASSPTPIPNSLFQIYERWRRSSPAKPSRAAVQMRVLITFTALAILLAGLGIYGLLSFTVSLRQQEFGIRMALGAARGDISSYGVEAGSHVGCQRLDSGTGIGLPCGKIAAELARRSETRRRCDILHSGWPVPDNNAVRSVGAHAARCAD